jgi:MYXO-CTERM domain-containing protein
VVTLSSGQTYYIAENYAGAGDATLPVLTDVDSLTTVGQITYGAGIAAFGFNQTPTTNGLYAGTDPSFFGPDFEIAPEPSTLAMGATALAALAVFQRRRSPARDGVAFRRSL